MAKLYPPLIEGILPAFTSEIVTHELEINGETYTSSSKRTYLEIQFEHNPSVDKFSTKGMQLYMLAAQDNSLITAEKFYWTNDNQTGVPIISDSSIQFELTGYQYKLIVGNYYKVQLAYIDSDDVIGYYSTVGIVKYTTAPEVTITRDSEIGTKFQSVVVQSWTDTSNEQLYTYYDATEKLYSVVFELYKAKLEDEIWAADGKAVATSGIILHNTNNDIGKEQIDEYDFGIDLGQNTYYICVVRYTTINQLKGQQSSKEFFGTTLASKEELNIEFSRDNGSILLKEDKEYQRQEVEIGNEELKPWLSLGHKQIDCTVEYGKQYKYSYIESGVRYTSKDVTCYFDDAFLYDGEKQLCIKYNPQMNSIKDTILETKVDTIGGKYPYIYRNGIVRYKEFSIGGLISYTMDKDGYFMDGISAAVGSRTGTPETSTEFQAQEFSTNLSDENVKRELEFKMAVLEWLNNGKPKLFRSPTEGNYLVRLMNVSLTPTKEVGRMLHSFTATAYEIDDHDLKTLKKYGIIGG